MIHGFDLTDPLVCEGIVGDGCGGGRIFYVKDTALFAYDPVANDSLLLLEDIEAPKHIAKSGCLITITCQSQRVVFDLSCMHRV